MAKKIFTEKDTIELKDKFFKNPIYQKIKKKFPYRDYEYQFELMCDWWLETKKKLPVSITAFNQWISRTQVDESIKNEIERLYKEEQWKIQQKEREEQKCKDASEYLNKIKKELINKMKT